MRFVRKNAEVKVMDVFSDDRVSVAISKLERFLGDAVYMWTVRAVTPHEGLGIVIEDTGWSSADETIDGRDVERSLRKLFGVSVKAPKAVDRLWVIGALRGKDLEETVACAFRYISVGGYFADHGVDPFRNIPRGFSPKNQGFVDTSQLLLESFGTEVFYVATRADLEGLRPPKTDARAWEAVVARYRFRDNESGDNHDAETLRYNDLLGDNQNVSVAERTLTYIKVAGACIFRRPGIDTLMTSFADLQTSPEMPMVRIGNHALGTVLTRLHDSFVNSPELERYVVSTKKNFMQVLLRIPESPSYALLEAFPDKFYLSARFSVRDTNGTDTFARVFPAVNEFLARVSPYYVPLTEGVFRSDYVNNSIKISDYRASLVDMWYSVEILSKKRLCDVRVFYTAAIDGGPVLKPVNVSQDERKAFLQFVRSSNVSKEALVRNFLVHNSGASGPVLIRRIVADYGLSSEDAAEMVREFYEFRRFAIANVTTVRADKKSSSRVLLRIELLRDERYVDRVANAVAVLFDECTMGAKRRVVASVDVIKTISDKVQSKIGDIDEFMDLVNISEPGLAQDSPDEIELGDSGMGSDVLRALQQRDPAVFGFKASGVFRPYSVQCQDRQPVVLTDEELERAVKGSTDGSFKGSVTYGSDRQFNYICPRKWCVTSKVARKQGEACPLPDEPEYDFGETTYPGYITGSKHPAGLCMPCCFKKEPLPGSKVHDRKAVCEGLSTKTDSAAPARPVAHLSRSDRILDYGFVGKIPDALARHFPDGFVRRGMGSNTSFFDAVEFVFDDTRFADTFSKKMAYHHFLAGDPRRADRGPGSPDAGFAAWWKSPESATYRSVFSLKTLSQAQARRETVAYSIFRRSVVSRADTHEVWLRPINSFTPSSRPHIVVVSDGPDGASISIDEIRPDRTEVAFLLHRAGRYEPLGYINDREFFASVPWTQPWARRVVDAQAPPAVPADARRVLNTNYMVVAVLFPGGSVLALPSPVSFNPKYAHVHLSDVPRTATIAHKEARRMRDPFYRSDHIEATEVLLKDSDVDLQLFVGDVAKDRRDDVLRDVRAKDEAEGRYAKAVWDVIGDDPLVYSGRETGARVAQLRKKYSAKLPKLPPYIADYIIERLLRPVGVTTVPVVNKSDDEVILSATK